MIEVLWFAAKLVIRILSTCLYTFLSSDGALSSCHEMRLFLRRHSVLKKGEGGIAYRSSLPIFAKLCILLQSCFNQRGQKFDGLVYLPWKIQEVLYSPSESLAETNERMSGTHDLMNRGKLEMKGDVPTTFTVKVVFNSRYCGSRPGSSK